MPAMLDLIGKQFGDWLVVGLETKTPNRVRRWLCQCSCGNTGLQTSGTLNFGTSQSCGHWRTSERLLTNEESAFRVLFRVMRFGAKKRNYVWELSHQDVARLIAQRCFYCNALPTQIARPGHYRRRLNCDNGTILFYNGLDRLNNATGYTKANVVPCCGTCNWMKMDLSVDEFREKIQQIYHYFVKCNHE